MRSPVTARLLLAGAKAALSKRSARDSEVRAASILRGRFPALRPLFVDSGTSALALALRALRAASPGRTGPVALPAYACYDLATAVHATGTPFVLYDLDPATLGPDPDSLRDALSHGVTTVAVAHLYGLPADMRLVRRIALTVNAQLIDDAAQAFGATLDDRPIGAWGDAGVLSFGRGKGVTAGGGGALLLPDALPNPTGFSALSAAEAGLRALVLTAAQWMLGRPALYGLPASIPGLGLGATVFRAPHPERQATRFSLGALVEALGLMDAELASRRASAERYSRMLSGSTVAIPAPPVGASPSYLRYPVIPARGIAQRIRRGDGRSLGIAPGYPLSLADLPGFGDRRTNGTGRFEGARFLAANLVTLPVHSAVREAEFSRIADWCARG